MSNPYKLGSMLLIIAMTMLTPLLLVSCGKTGNGSQESTAKPPLPDELYYGYLKTKSDTSTPAGMVQFMQSYLRAYPKGKHVGEAMALLEDAKQEDTASACINNLRQIEPAKDQYALDHSNAVASDLSDLVGPNLYIKNMPVCPGGGTYTLNELGINPTCSVGGRHVLP